MDSFESDDGYVIVQLEPGDLVLESLREAIDDHDIDTGAVVSGIGTLSNFNFHYVHTTDISDPDARNTQVEREGAWEVTNVEGVIADGEPHLHVSAYDGEETVGGHLEEGNEINVLGEFTIRKIEGLDLTREKTGELRISQLTER
jgi:predicted DNA-binding protein with PD1-like motif